MEEHVQNKSWFKRNWPWVIPVGGCLTVIILAFVGLGAAVFGGIKAFKNAAPYEYAVNLAKENSEVQKILGDEIDTDGMFQGNLTFKNSTGKADIKIPIKGSKGTGTIIVLGDKYDDEWSYEELYVLIKETNEKINLLEKDLEGF